MAKYIHSTSKRYLHSKKRSRTGAAGTFKRAIDFVLERVSANFTTVERVYGAEFPAWGTPLGANYDQTKVTKTNRNPSIS